MTRKLRNPPDFGPVADYPVAPHRYRWDTPSEDVPDNWRAVRDAAPYKVGEVVYVVYGAGFAKAIISLVDSAKTSHDEWRETYRVHRETKKGEWSKLFYVAHPGFIQRGYQRAGLAPDMPVEK